MRSRYLVPFFLVLPLGCAGAPRATGPSETPLTAATVPAPAVGKTYPVRVLEGRFNADVFSTAIPVVSSKLEESGATTSTIGLKDGEKDIACIVTSDLRNPGAFVARAFSAMATAMSLEAVGFPTLEVQLAQRAPLVWATSHAGSEKTGTEFRAGILAREGGSILCLTEGLAEERFRAVVTGLTGSAHHDGWTKARFSEASLLHENGALAGIEQRYIHDHGELTTYGTVFHQHEGQWRTADWSSVDVVDPRGEIQSSRVGAFVNGVPFMSMRVERKGSKEYVYELDGPENTHAMGKLQTKGPLTTELSRAAAVRAFVSGKERERSFAEIDHDLTKVSVVPVLMKKTGSRGLALAYGAKKSSVCDVAIDGLCAKEDVVDAGGDKHTWERICVDGSP